MSTIPLSPLSHSPFSLAFGRAIEFLLFFAITMGLAVALREGTKKVFRHTKRTYFSDRSSFEGAFSHRIYVRGAGAIFFCVGWVFLRSIPSSRTSNLVDLASLFIAVVLFAIAISMFFYRDSRDGSTTSGSRDIK